ncbi:unnamed protein product, partial [Discosporangium mesarthrocarpum]
LKWWKANRKYFPYLFKMTCKFLFIQSTSAFSERKFSMVGNIVTPMRNRISCEVI